MNILLVLTGYIGTTFVLTFLSDRLTWKDFSFTCIDLGLFSLALFLSGSLV